MNTQPATLVPTPGALERAGLRLELAESNMRLWQPSGDDDHDEETFGRVEAEQEAARRAYRAMVELATGMDANVLERRLSL